MNVTMKFALAAAGLALAAQAAAQVTFYEREGFEGRSFTTKKQVGNFERYGFNDRASSVVVDGSDRWEVCEDARFSGRCVVLRPGPVSVTGRDGPERPRFIGAGREQERAHRRQSLCARAAAWPPQITFYEREGFDGRSFTTDEAGRQLRAQRLQ